MREPELTTVPRDLYYHEVAYVRGLEAALARYRYAVHFAAADAWDCAADIRARFEWARSNDPRSTLTDDEAANIGKGVLGSGRETRV